MPSLNRESYLLDNLKVDIEISPDLQNLINNSGDLAPQAIKLGLRKVTKEGSKQVKAKIRSLGLVKSGELAKSVRGSTTNRKSYIGTKLWYAHFLEGGTDPHTIKPKKNSGNKYLWWRGLKPPGVKKVNHPGVKAYRFTGGTFEKMQSSGEINSLFAQGVQEAIEELSK
jgi:phage gpG-like protein